MAKARMLHNNISISTKVNDLSLKAALLFTWMISHADDDGRLLGDAKYIKAKVVPMRNWSPSSIETLLKEVADMELIYRWCQNKRFYIEFPTWKDHQSIPSDRYKKSLVPAYNKKQLYVDTNDSQADSKMSPQYNVMESNTVESNISEGNTTIADLKPYKDENSSDPVISRSPVTSIVSPRGFKPENADDAAAFFAWNNLEPYNQMAFTNTYYPAYKKGLTASMFHQFTSEIKQDPTITNKGAVFNSKVKTFFEKQLNNV